MTTILNYAVDNVSFYRQFKRFGSLSDFPVINKKIVKDNENAFIANGYDKEKLFRQETSGSTGMPFVVYQDVVKRRRATADTLFFSHIANYEPGMRLYVSRVWGGMPRPSNLECIERNWVTHDSDSLSEDSIRMLLDMWEKDMSTKSVLMFASSLTAIAKYIARNNFKPKAKIASFITMSEALDPWTKETISKSYGTAVVSRYSNQELGIMAQQLPGRDDFLVNTASFYFEILDMDEDKPAAPGKEGRIVVTDLFSRAMPLIRYDTGDVAVIKEVWQDDQRNVVFTEVGGRKLDYIYDTASNMVSPYVINNPMHQFLEISQYQFIQETEKEYTMLLNVQDGVFFGREDEMVSMLKSYLGKDAEITVRYVSDIPVLKSGKRKQVVNRYRPGDK